jgi:hypothetical protein
MGEQALVAKKMFRNYDVVIGHLGGRIFDDWPQDFFSCTLVRNPIDRALSTYYYFQTLPSLSISQVEAIRGMSLEDFVSSKTPAVNEILNNPLSRHFAAAYGYADSYADATAVWQAAVHGFEKYRVIGVCEQFEKSVEAIFDATGLPSPKVNYSDYQLNKNESRTERSSISSDIIRRIESRSFYDLALYENALKKINGQISTASFLDVPAGQSKFVHLIKIREVKIRGSESGGSSLKTGETLDITVKFDLLTPTSGFWYLFQIRNLSGEVLFGKNSHDGSEYTDLRPGKHEVAISIDIMLKHGKYMIGFAAGGSEEDHTFGILPKWATPEPIGSFDVLGNTGQSFYGAFKLPVKRMVLN